MNEQSNLASAPCELTEQDLEVVASGKVIGPPGGFYGPGYVGWGWGWGWGWGGGWGRGWGWGRGGAVGVRGPFGGGVFVRW